MDKQWLQDQLGEGRSMEDIAREVSLDPSTVAYWVRKHGLESQHAARHRAKGGIPRSVLEELVAEGLSTRQIAERLERSQATVRHWLGTFGLSTRRRRPRHVDDESQVHRECPTHGLTIYTRYGVNDSYRCLECRKARVIARRRRIKEILVEEAGGACVLCGYDRYIGALQFHHVDPTTKEFGIALNGAARSLDRARAEARKCVLVCGNCHAEVEAGIATLPVLPGRPG